MDEQKECATCDSSGWVCENHRDKPWEGATGKACGCGGAGAPCPICNYSPTRDDVPRMPPGFKVICEVS